MKNGIIHVMVNGVYVMANCILAELSIGNPGRLIHVCSICCSMANDI